MLKFRWENTNLKLLNHGREIKVGSNSKWRIRFLFTFDSYGKRINEQISISDGIFPH